jgi:hypothetical protein
MFCNITISGDDNAILFNMLLRVQSGHAAAVGLHGLCKPFFSNSAWIGNKKYLQTVRFDV